MFYQVFTGKTSFPLSVTLSGTFSSNGTTIITSISVPLQIGNYLYSSTYNQVRKITGINTAPNSYTIESAFSDSVTNDNVQITDTSIVYKSVNITCFNGADGKLNGAIFPLNTSQEIKESGAVFTIDGTGTWMGILAVI